MRYGVVKVKPWDEVERLAKERGINPDNMYLTDRCSYGEYIYGEYDEEGNIHHWGIKYEPWEFRNVDVREVLEYGRILKSETIDNITINVVEFCNAIFYIRKCRTKKYNGYAVNYNMELLEC